MSGLLQQNNIKEMSQSENAKQGIRLLGQSSDVTFCVPPKKRHLLWPQSPGSISPSATTYSPNACHQMNKDGHVQEHGSSGPGTEADTSVSVSAPSSTPYKTANLKSSPGRDNQEPVPAYCVPGTQADTKGTLHKEDTFKPIAEKGELSSAPKNLDDLATTNEAGEELPIHEFKVPQAEDHETKSSEQLLLAEAVKDCSGSAHAINKLETLYPCTKNTVGEDVFNESFSEKPGCSELCSDRSNWDLNTVMDSWERSLSDADQKESSSHEHGMEEICHEGFKSHNNHASFLGDNLHSDSNIELKLNSSMNNLAQVSHACPSHLLRPNSYGDATRLNLFMSLTCTMNSAGNNKPFDQRLVDKMSPGKQNANLMMLKNVKNEPCEVPTFEAVKVNVPNNLKLVHNAIVKSETQVESFQNISSNIQEKDQSGESQSDSLETARFRHNIHEKSKNFQYIVPRVSVGECKSMSGLLSEVPTDGDTLQTDVCQAVHLNVNMDSVSTVKMELPESGKLGMNMVITETGCSSTGEDIVNPGTLLLDSKPLHGTHYTGMPSENYETVNKFALVSEIPSDVKINKCEYAAAQPSPHKSFDSNVTSQVNDVLNRFAEVPRGDGLVSFVARSLGDNEQIDSCGSKMVTDTDKAELLSSQLSVLRPCTSESLSTPKDFVLSHVTSRQPIDDDIEDGEVRDSQQAGVAILPGHNKKIKNVCIDKATSAEPVPGTATAVNEKGGRVTEISNFIETENSTFSDFSDKDPGKMLSTIVSEEQRPSTPKLPAAREPFEKKNIKSEVPDHALQETEQLLPNKVSNKSHGLPAKESAGEVDAFKMNPEESLPSPDSKVTTMSKPDVTLNISEKDVPNCAIQLNSSSKDSSSERRNASDRKWVPPKNVRGRPCNQLYKGDGPHRRGNRVETCNIGPRIIKREWKRDETSRKVGSDIMQHGRAKRTLQNDQNPDVDYVSERFNNADNYRFTRHKNVPDMTSVVSTDCAINNTNRAIRSLPVGDIDNFSQVPSRRRSPGGRGRPFGRMIRPRDISPRRYAEPAGPNAVLMNREESFLPNLREHMVDASTFAGPCSDFERGENSFMRRRSLSPTQRRGLPRLPHMCSPSRRRPHSPCPLSPQRSPDDFDGHSEAIPPRELWVDRTRSPRRRDLFMGDMAGRRHVSPPPYIPRLHDGMRDDSPLRTYSFARNGRSFQRNTRNFHLINTEGDGEGEYFGPPLHSGQIRELPPEENVDDVRNCNERHGLVHPFRRYNIADNECDEEFNFRIERNAPPPRPVRFHTEVKEEFPERDDLHGGIRHHMGEMPRRMRAIEERGGVCQRNGNQGWPDSSFGDDRLKRRRY